MNRLLTALLAGLTALAPAVAAAPYDHTVSLVGGLAGMGAPPSYGGGVDGRVWLAAERSAIELGARELYATEDARTVGAIVAGVRVAIRQSPLYWRLAFAHSHEIPIEVVLDSPVAAVAGVAEGISHRTGAELGLAWSAGLAPRLLAGSALADRLGVNADLGLAGVGGEDGFRASLYGGLHLTVGLGPARSASPGD